LKTFVYTGDQAFFNDVCEIVRMFTGPAAIALLPAPRPAAEPFSASVLLGHRYAGGAFVDEAQVVIVDGKGNVARRVRHRSVEPYAGESGLAFRRFSKRAAKNAVYVCMQKAFPTRLPWGSLTGIRPTRLVREMCARGLGETETARALEREFFLEPQKARLLVKTVSNQRGVLATQGGRDLNVYIAIPFCVTRCVYCSFPSYALGRHEADVAPYLDALHEEIESAGRCAGENGWKPRCLYVGGGTPTSIPAAALSSVVEHALSAFGDFMEITVEAGRPDTLDDARLSALRSLGVHRISINPQTMNAKTLRAVGRNHTPEDTVRAFGRAREAGFGFVNMDLILGLPGEGVKEAEHTLREALRLRPENLTVHTLALKRASALMQNRVDYALPDAVAVSEMVDLSRRMAAENGYAPYYLYRQKYMTGNFENVGYCLKGFPCAYNVDIMEETTSNMALGSGAISKRVFDAERRIERLPNPKSLRHYIDNIGGHIAKKEAFFARADD